MNNGRIRMRIVAHRLCKCNELAKEEFDAMCWRCMPKVVSHSEKDSCKGIVLETCIFT